MQELLLVILKFKKIVKKIENVVNGKLVNILEMAKMG